MKTGQTKSEHTPGAIRAAEIITGGEYGDGYSYFTSYGRKSVEEIADIIEAETGFSELLNALRAIVGEAKYYTKWNSGDIDTFSVKPEITKSQFYAARAAIKLAEEGRGE